MKKTALSSLRRLSISELSKLRRQSSRPSPVHGEPSKTATEGQRPSGFVFRSSPAERPAEAGGCCSMRGWLTSSAVYTGNITSTSYMPTQPCRAVIPPHHGQQRRSLLL